MNTSIVSDRIEHSARQDVRQPVTVAGARRRGPAFYDGNYFYPGNFLIAQREKFPH
jgi:hypothetical protein